MNRRGPAGRTAMSWERSLFLRAHPVAYPLLRGLARMGPVVRLPRAGVVVNDAALASEVLADEERFPGTGPGASAGPWTPVLGPPALLPQEGGEARRLRRRLVPLFSTGSTERSCQRILADPLARLDVRLERGEPVELVDVVRVMTGAVVCELIGLEVTGPADAREETYRHYTHLGGQLTAAVRRRGRRSSGEGAGLARALLGPIADVAARAYAEGDETTVAGRMRGLGLSEHEARGATGEFFLAATEPVVAFVPRLVALLYDSGRLPDVSAALRAGDERPLDAAIEEALRVTMPAPLLVRGVARPTRIGSARVRPGDRVLVAAHNCARASGGFDPDSAAPPAEIRRTWRGAVRYAWLGQPIATIESRAVARVVLRHAPLRVVDRRAARDAPVPAYERLEIIAA